MNTDLLYPLIGAFVVGLGAGHIGSLMVLRRMSLVGDALSHVALPGLGLALLYSFNPFIGAFSALIVAVVAVWFLQERTSLPSETLVGIFFTLSLATGLLITPEHELLEALFGDVSRIGASDIALTVISVIVIAMILTRITRGVMLSIISEDLARANGINSARLNLLFLLAVALIVALGIKVTGTLLTGSLVIIPAAAALNVALSLARYLSLSAIFGAVAGVSGVLLAWTLGIPPGPMIVLTGGLIFVVSLFFRR